MKDKDTKSDDAVGYGRPPRAGRFKKGRSGNPGGRPKKAAEERRRAAISSKLRDIVLEEAMAPVTIQENGESVRMPALQAVMRRMKLDALKGSHKAQVALKEWVEAAEAGRLAEKHELFKAAVEYLDRCAAETEARCAAGLPRPSFLPDPEDIALDVSTGDVFFNGPRTPDEKKQWDYILALREDSREQLDYLNGRLEEDPGNPDLMQTRDRECELYFRLRAAAPTPEERRSPGFRYEEWQHSHDEILKQLRAKRRIGKTELACRDIPETEDGDSKDGAGR